MPAHRAERYNDEKDVGQVTEAGASQMAPTVTPSSKVTIQDMMDDLGGYGTTLVNGFFEPDYNAKLAGTVGLDTFDKMRKSDAQVFGTLSAVELPIRGADWFIDPANDEDGKVSPENDEVAEFVEQALFEKMEQTWDDLIREILTMLPFGFACHEKIYIVDDDHVWLRGLESRKQRTIYRWEMENGAPGVTQVLPYIKPAGGNEGKNFVSIPAAKLAIFTFRREGLNYQGTSVLRSAYQHWHMKQQFYKFDAVKHEKQSLGVPIITMPEKATKEDKAVAQAMVDRIRVNERAGIVLDFDWKFEFADMKAHTTSDLFPSIEHHNREIAKNVLAQFLEIGGHSGSGGAKATSEDHSELFYLAENAVAQQIADTFNRFVIPELVSLNFNGIKQFPHLKFKKIGKDKFADVMKALTDLVTARVVVPDDPLEEHVRDYLDLPSKPDDAPPRPTAPTGGGTQEVSDETDAGIGESDDKTQYREFGDAMAVQSLVFDKMHFDHSKAVAWAKKHGFSAEKVEENGTSYRMRQWEPSEGGGFRTKRLTTGVSAVLGKKGAKAAERHDHGPYKRFSSLIDNGTILRLQRAVITEDRGKLKKKGFKFSSDEGRYWRAMTFAERKVRLNTIEDAFSRFDKRLQAGIDGITDSQKRTLMKQVRDALESGDASMLPEIGVQSSSELSSLLTDIRSEMFDIGKQTAANEMDVPVPPTAGDVRSTMIKQHDEVASDLAADMTHAAKVAASDAMTNGDTAEEAAAAASDAIDTALEATNELRTLTINGSLNMGRAAVFERYPEEVYAMQYSAILDDVTCDYCMSLDGLVLTPAEALGEYDPPAHYNCRCVLVEILNDEAVKPDIETAPDGIPPIGSLDDFQDLDAPIVKADSPAAEILQQEADARQELVDQYKADGTYANRVTDHESRINDILDQIGPQQDDIPQTRLDFEDGGHVLTPDGYVYHSSTPEAEAGIAQSGLQPMTNRRDSEARVYLAPDASIATAAAADQGDNSVLYRVKTSAIDSAYQDPHIPGGISFYTKAGIAPADVEKFDPSTNTWKPLPGGRFYENLKTYLSSLGVRFHD